MKSKIELCSVFISFYVFLDAVPTLGPVGRGVHFLSSFDCVQASKPWNCSSWVVREEKRGDRGDALLVRANNNRHRDDDDDGRVVKWVESASEWLEKQRHLRRC